MLRLTLEELGYPQPPTQIHVNNTTVTGIANNTIKRQRSQAMEMRYFWLLDHKSQHIFWLKYHPGAENLADYFTKGFNAIESKRKRPLYFHTQTSPQFLNRAELLRTRRGCVGTLRDSHRVRSRYLAHVHTQAT